MVAVLAVAAIALLIIVVTSVVVHRKLKKINDSLTEAIDGEVELICCPATTAPDGDAKQTQTLL